MTYTKEQIAKIRQLCLRKTQTNIDPDAVGRERTVQMVLWSKHKKERAYINVLKENGKRESAGYIDLATGELHPKSSLASALYCLKGFNL